MKAYDWYVDHRGLLPDHELSYIIEETTSISRGRLRFDASDISDSASKMDQALLRRINGEPLQYIFNSAPFYGYEYYVDERVLIPRADTEILVEYADAFIKSNRVSSLLDLCAGSGCIGVTLARLNPAVSVTLSDISKDACEVCRINSKSITNVEILQGDMFAPVRNRRFDVITVNPPYICSSEISSLDADVRKEPFLALDGGNDGLEFYRRIASGYRDHLTVDGLLLCEIGFDQAESVSSLFDSVQIIKDYGGNSRVAIIRG